LQHKTFEKICRQSLKTIAQRKAVAASHKRHKLTLKALVVNGISVSKQKFLSETRKCIIGLHRTEMYKQSRQMTRKIFNAKMKQRYRFGVGLTSRH